MRTHTFNLILAGVSELTPELADRLYEATGGDLELNMRDGVAFAEFHRKARTLREAVLAAIRQIESAGAGVRVVRVDTEDANTITRINAELLTSLADH